MKDIEGYEGLYAITSCGKVWSHRRKKLMSPKKDKYGYLTIQLCKNKHGKRYFVHRLVAKAYLPNPNNFPEVHHKDANKVNNSTNNLEWLPREYNLAELYVRKLKNLGISIDIVEMYWYK